MSDGDDGNSVCSLHVFMCLGRQVGVRALNKGRYYRDREINNIYVIHALDLRTGESRWTTEQKDALGLPYAGSRVEYRVLANFRDSLRVHYSCHFVYVEDIASGIRWCSDHFSYTENLY